MSAKKQNVNLAANLDTAELEAPASISLESLMMRSIGILEAVSLDVKETRKAAEKGLAVGMESAAVLERMYEEKLSGEKLASDKKQHAELKRRFGTDRFNYTYPQWVKANRPRVPAGE